MLEVISSPSLDSATLLCTAWSEHSDKHTYTTPLPWIQPLDAFYLINIIKSATDRKCILTTFYTLTVLN